MGFFVLQGGAEFGGMMRASDTRAFELAGGMDVPASIVPAAAAPDNNHHRAGQTGLRWFRSLGAVNVEVLPLIDSASADDALVVSKLASSRLIYLLGGFPRYLANTLAGSAALNAMTAAFENGAVLAGSSAGAMVMCGHYYDPIERTVAVGLNLLPAFCILPHHNRSGANWANAIRSGLPQTVLIGIDEETGLVSDALPQTWRVHGRGGVTVYRNEETIRYADQDDVAL